LTTQKATDLINGDQGAGARNKMPTVGIKRRRLSESTVELAVRHVEENQMKAPTTNITSIDEYIQSFPEEVQVILSELRSTIRQAAPQAIEKISYRMPTFYYNGNLVHFAAHKNHVGFYPTPSGITAFREELKKYKSAKGSVQLPIVEPLPLNLIARIVTFRVTENAQKSVKVPKRGA